MSYIVVTYIAKAGKAMGSPELLKKFEDSLSKLRRDIVA
jgi:hypothetical protein